jgi:hypothetical protein
MKSLLLVVLLFPFGLIGNVLGATIYLATFTWACTKLTHDRLAAWVSNTL